MGSTQETKAEVKNGVKRMIFAVASILLEVAVILLLIYFAGQKAGWIYVLFRFMAVVLVLAIFGSSKTSSIRMTWMFVILVLPVFGAALYLLIGLNGHTLRMRKRYMDIDKILFPMLPDDGEVFEKVEKKNGHLAGIVNYIRRNASYPVYQNTEVQYFDDAAKGIEAQKKDMAKAEKFIFMEYHAIEDAESWHAIRDVLVERVKAGVEVRVFYDDMGSIGFINKDFVKRTEELGIKCRVFNPFGPGLNVFLNNRDHRKITVIDGKVGYTGGRWAIPEATTWQTSISISQSPMATGKIRESGSKEMLYRVCWWLSSRCGTPQTRMIRTTRTSKSMWLQALPTGS